MNDVALITGITGQDGYYLAKELLAQGMRVVGTTREMAGARSRLEDLADRVALVAWDLVDAARFERILQTVRPTHVFNLAAFTSGEFMDRDPQAVTDINGVAVLRMLEAIRSADPAIRFVQASSSEVFAQSGVSPQNELTAKVPRSVYGAAKIFADNIIALYRQKYGLFCCSAFLFNHESPRRGDGFVTTKVVRAAVAIKAGEQENLLLGNLSAARDWGYAGDYMRAMELMALAPEPADYAIATGTAHTVAELCARAFAAVGLDHRDHVEVDPRFYRPTEPAPIVGDARLARERLGWQPETSFDALIAMMVEAELSRRSEGLGQHVR